jgi:chromate reductase
MTTKLLAISGSLRHLSVNTMLLRAFGRLAPGDVEIDVFQHMADLPLFNPDLEGSEPVAVLDFRRQISSSAGVLISSPEYAHGVSGVMKNALDWVVGSGELSNGKPVAILNASYSSQYADAQLREIISTMDAHLVHSASISIPVQGRRLDEASLVAHPELSVLIRSVLREFILAIRFEK